MDGRILTRSFEFETRQHSLLGLDLGDGVARDFLVLGSLCSGVWFAALTALFGLPDSRSIIFYVTLPLTVVYFGFQPDPKKERRKRITGWILRARYAVRGYEPIINGRRRKGGVGWKTRVNAAAIRAWVAGDDKVWESAAATIVDKQPAPPVRVDQVARLIGFDAMTQVRDGRNKKKRRRGKNV